MSIDYEVKIKVKLKDLIPNSYEVKQLIFSINNIIYLNLLDSVSNIIVSVILNVLFFSLSHMSYITYDHFNR